MVIEKVIEMVIEKRVTIDRIATTTIAKREGGFVEMLFWVMVGWCTWDDMQSLKWSLKWSSKRSSKKSIIDIKEKPITKSHVCITKNLDNLTKNLDNLTEL